LGEKIPTLASLVRDDKLVASLVWDDKWARSDTFVNTHEDTQSTRALRNIWRMRDERRS